MRGFFFAQGHPFFHTISRDIGFRTVAAVPDRSYGTILRELNLVINLFRTRGFIVVGVHSDCEFECVREDIRPIHLDVVPPDCHVGEIERSVETVKERLRATVHGLPFKRIPKLLVVHIVTDAVRCLNQFPWVNGISSESSPLSLVTGAAAPDYNGMRVELGQYVQVFEPSDPTNTPKARALGAIALTPTGNANGDYYFLSLATGARISRHQWTELPITDTCIARVEALAKNEGQPLIQARGLVVEWRPGHLVDDDEYDLNFDIDAPNADPGDEPFDADDYDDIAGELADLHVPEVVPHAPLALVQGAPEGNDHDDVQPATADDVEAEPEDQGAEDQGAHPGAADDDDAEDEGADPYGSDDDADDDDGDIAIAIPDPDIDEGATPGNAARYNLRPRAPTAAQQRFNAAMDEPHNAQAYYPPTQLLQVMQENGHNLRAAVFETMLDKLTAPGRKRNAKEDEDAFLVEFAYMLTQMTARAGIKKHGKAAEAALMAEFAQLEDMTVYEPIDPATLTKKQRQAALRALNLIKEKRDGRLKGRTVADGRPQRLLYEKSETTSPTVSTDALMLSIMVDAHEGRDVATADVVGAYLKAYMDEFVVMKFTGESVDILCKMNEKYSKFVVMEGKTKVLYVKLIKAIYGCVKSALLWYQLFTESLEGMGFVLNPYDPCIANCTIEGSQCTVAWYVDDNKISHANPNVVTMIIDKIEQQFGKMTVTRGREHVFLGMNITYTDQKTAIITMKEYLREAIAESELGIKRQAATPATRELFEVSEKASRLPQRRSDIFHRIVTKLLYVAIRARMDLLLAVGFLCTRVSKSTVEDEGKLRRLLEYINGSIDKEYTLGADDLERIRTWVDASYAVHPDMRSHTGGLISFGRGGLICKSSKQKLNTKSSTEAEVVGASDYLPHTLWVQMFLEAQGYAVKESILEQDNESAIKLEKNGRASAGPRSRHIDIRYFWIKDRTKAAGIKIRHCPTAQMLGDFFTKPLQGSLFRKFRDAILGYSHVDSLKDDSTMPTEERVGDQQDGQTGRRGSDRSALASVTSETSESVRLSGDEAEKNESDRGTKATARTWANVVKFASSPHLADSNKIVSSSFSRNNPVCRTKV